MERKKVEDKGVGQNVERQRWVAQQAGRARKREAKEHGARGLVLTKARLFLQYFMLAHINIHVYE